MQNGILYFKHFLIKLIVNSPILTQMLSKLVSFLCHTTTKENYEKGISWDRQFFAGSGIEIPIASGIRD